MSKIYNLTSSGKLVSDGTMGKRASQIDVHRVRYTRFINFFQYHLFVNNKQHQRRNITKRCITRILSSAVIQLRISSSVVQLCLTERETESQKTKQLNHYCVFENYRAAVTLSLFLVKCSKLPFNLSVRQTRSEDSLPPVVEQRRECSRWKRFLSSNHWFFAHPPPHPSTDGLSRCSIGNKRSPDDRFERGSAVSRSKSQSFYRSTRMESSLSLSLSSLSHTTSRFASKMIPVTRDTVLRSSSLARGHGDDLV